MLHSACIRDLHCKRNHHTAQLQTSDDFKVVISENNPEKPQVWRVLLDEEFEAKLKIIKKDDETKKSVLVPNTEFKVYDLDNKKYVEQVTTYPSTTVHKSYLRMKTDT